MAITKATASSIAPAAKGDLVAGTATNDAGVLGVGANDTVLTADSAEATGLKWAAAASGGSMTSIASGSLSGTSVTISSIPSGYRNIFLVLENIQSNNDWVFFRFNGETGTNYARNLITYNSTSILSGAGTTAFKSVLGGSANYPMCGYVEILEYATSKKGFNVNAGLVNYGAASFNYIWGQYFNTTAAPITSITVFGETGASFSAGTYVLYGVK